ncbi:MAG: exodeoxyribonuclease VII large subunit [Duodenibacillus sp.]|nr:exodeoxyribonuclease VII large subunit [Duodenibacillus sp.]
MYEEFGHSVEPQTGSIPGVAHVLRRISALMSRQFGRFELIGEIQGLKKAMSGHVYFDLKDTQEDALLSCALFRTQAQALKFQPKDGDVVIVSGELNLYAPRGQISFVVRSIKLAGAGDLYAQFVALKEKLQSLGYFDESRKKAIPKYPRRIGIVTSLRGAALQDVLKTIKQRAPFVNVVIYPTSVQGEGAVDEILRALDAVQERREVSVVLLVRGGGSLADLWCFNSERLARRLVDMPVPVVAGVGHESDVTIADLVSDWRAATPTAAAVKVTEYWMAVLERMDEGTKRLQRVMRSRIEQAQWQLTQFDRIGVQMRYRLKAVRAELNQLADLSGAMQRYMLNLDKRLERCSGKLAGVPAARLQEERLTFERAEHRLRSLRPDPTAALSRIEQLESTAKRLFKGEIAIKRERVKALSSKLRALDVNRVLDRGYALALDDSGRIVRDASQLSVGQSIDLRLAKGGARGRIESTRLE